MPPTPNLDVPDWIAVLLLGALVVGVVYLAREVAAVRELVEPIATSPLVRGLSGAGVS